MSDARGAVTAWSRRGAVGILVVMFALLAVESFYPFEPQWPVGWRTTPSRTPAGSLRFDGRSVLVSPSPPAWLAVARRSGNLEVNLEARAEQAPQEGPARLLTISRDSHEANMMIGQHGDALVVRVRRPGSDASGQPAFEVPHLFTDTGWHALQVRVAGDHLRIEVDGHMRVSHALVAGGLACWDTGHRIALGNEPQGERGWIGELRRAQVVTPTGATDLLSPGMLVPKRGVVVRTRVRTHLLSPADDPFYLVALRVVSFVPIGLALQRLVGRRALSMLCIIGLAGLLLVGKLFIAGRHPAISDTVWSILGGMVGYFIGNVLKRRQPLSPR